MLHIYRKTAKYINPQKNSCIILVQVALRSLKHNNLMWISPSLKSLSPVAFLHCFPCSIFLYWFLAMSSDCIFWVVEGQVASSLSLQITPHQGCCSIYMRAGLLFWQAGGMDWLELHKPQQRQVQSPTPGKDKALVMIQARDWQAGRSSVQKDLKTLADRNLNCGSGFSGVPQQQREHPELY